MMLVPGRWRFLSEANWWLPALLDRLLPHFTVEGPREASHQNVETSRSGVFKLVPRPTSLSVAE
jgi:hypothetical protein